MKYNIKIPEDIAVGTIHKSNNFGMFIVNEYINSKNITIKFLNTGFKCSIQAGDLRRGRAADKLVPTVCGVGFYGDGKYRAKVNGKHTLSYLTWKHMIERCYSVKQQKIQPTYTCCTVDPIWHDYQKFAAWFEIHHIDNYQLDKDIKIEGNKVYGPDACLMVSKRDNVIKAVATWWKFKSPDGENVEIYNLTEFCRNNNLSPQNMNAVAKGRIRSSSGWTKA